MYDKIKKLIVMECVHRLNQFVNLGLLPKSTSKYLNLFLYNYDGNITIHPVPSFFSYFEVLSNPSSLQ